VWGLPQAALAAPQLAVAAFQALGVKKKLPTLLEAVREAYQKQTGELAIPLANIQLNLDGYGPSKLGACGQKIPCFANIAKKNLPPVPKGLFLGIGGIGKKILVQFLLIDLQKETLIARRNKSFQGEAAFKKELPELMAQFFPNYGKLTITGGPKGAKVSVEGRQRGTLPMKPIIVPSSRAIKVTVEALKHDTKTVDVTVQKGAMKTVQIVLTPTALKRRIVIRRPPPTTTKGTPFYQTWWFWTVTGVVVVGAVGGTIGAVAASQPDVSSQAPFGTAP
jgi:hypothetical protein